MDKQFAESLKANRRKNGYTQEDLGKILGVTKSAVALWEKGERMPSTKNIKHLDELLGLNLPYNNAENEDAKVTCATVEERQTAIKRSEAKLTAFAEKYASLSGWAQGIVDGVLKSLQAECKARGELLPENYFNCDISFTVEGQTKLFPLANDDENE